MTGNHDKMLRSATYGKGQEFKRAVIQKFQLDHKHKYKLLQALPQGIWATIYVFECEYCGAGCTTNEYKLWVGGK